MMVSGIRVKQIHLRLCAIIMVCLVVVWLVRQQTQNQLKSFETVNDTIIQYEAQIYGFEGRFKDDLGHNGEPATLASEERARGEAALRAVALNTVLSDRIPLNRTLKDVRNPKCRSVQYGPLTLRTSVILIFYNEILSVILRTIWSVILRTPSHLLHEIILVDDYSTDESLRGLLQYYLETRVKDKCIVRLIRLKERMGLIRARLQGARAATADVLVFLDAHCEATVGWAEPLLSAIEMDRTVVAVPIIDVIEANNLGYSTNGESSFQVGGFSWSGHFTWIDVQKERQRNGIELVDTPTMAGGLFAIERNFFWDIGSYDEQMDGWGGENLEMSFRVWQCGGKLKTVPCSRVGHIFRDFHPYQLPRNKDTHGINTARLALVWMDDYKRLFFMHQPGLQNSASIGDVTHRLQLRRKLRCNSFKWYLDNVYPTKFIPDENVLAYGQVQNPMQMCLDDLQLADEKVGPLGLYTCHPFLAMSQYFSLSAEGQLRKENVCAEAGSGWGRGTRYGGAQARLPIQLTECHGHGRGQMWRLYRNGTIYHPMSGRCLSSNGVPNGKCVILERCSGSSAHQMWTFTYVNSTAVLI